MNISYDGKRVTFKTAPKELFEAEKSGTKPNTVRILDIEEYHQLRKHNPKKIIIQYQHEIFLRTITNIHATKGVFGKVIVVISWTNERYHHTIPEETVSPGHGDHTPGLDDNLEIPIVPPIHIRSGGKVTGEVTFTMTEGENAPAVGPHSVPVEPGPHNASAEQRPDMPTMPSIDKCVNCIRGMQEEEEQGPTPESPTNLDELALVLLPRTLIDALGRHRRGKSHADFVKELLIAHLGEEAEAAYRDKRAEERGPMHD
jgi:hypothetical protein